MLSRRRLRRPPGLVLSLRREEDMNSRIDRPLAAIILLLCALAKHTEPRSVPAAIIMTAGSAHEVAAPDSLLRGAFESNRRTRIFQEQSAMPLLNDVAVNITAPGVYFGSDTYTPGVVAAGTFVDSYLLHQDVRRAHARIILRGRVTFDQDIIGVIAHNDDLAATDPIFGVAGTLYPTGADVWRSMDSPWLPDRIRISADRRTLRYRFHTGAAMDQIRILTAATPIPSPGSVALLLTAGIVVGGRRRRNRS